MKLFKYCITKNNITEIHIKSGCLNKKVIILFDNDNENDNEVLENIMNTLLERKKKKENNNIN